MTDISNTSDSVNNFLAHYGVLGMKWGRRKREDDVVFTRTLKDGGSLTVTKNPDPAVTRFLSAINPKYKENSSKHHSFTLKDRDGTKVGDASFHQDSPDSLNLEWIGVKSKHRGKGYASAALQGAVNYAKDKNLKRLTLEVPGNSPDALHIYEKLGFKKIDSSDLVEDDAFWGGLTRMEYLVDNSVKHGYSIELAPNELFEYITRALDTLTEESEDIVSHTEIEPEPDSVDDFLAHYGVKGMKWGRRKNRPGVKTTPTSADHREAQRYRAKKPSQLTNNQLKKLTTRMELERKYNQLNPKKVNRGRAYVTAALGTAGLGITAYNMVKSPAGQAAIKLGSTLFNRTLFETGIRKAIER